MDASADPRYERCDDAEVGFALDGFEFDQRVAAAGLEGEE